MHMKCGTMDTCLIEDFFLNPSLGWRCTSVLRGDCIYHGGIRYVDHNEETLQYVVYAGLWKYVHLNVS
jgi:hypothetical protein